MQTNVYPLFKETRGGKDRAMMWRGGCIGLFVYECLYLMLGTTLGHRHCIPSLQMGRLRLTHTNLPKVPTASITERRLRILEAFTLHYL